MIIPANPDLCDYLTAKLKRRNKLIKLADRSVLGWDTVTEYEDDPSASDSDDGKKIRQAKNRALTKRKSKKSNKLILRVPTQKPGSMVNITAPAPHPPHTPSPKQRNSNSRFASNNLPKYFRRAKC